MQSTTILNFLNLSSLICEMGIITYFWRLNEMTLKYLAQGQNKIDAQLILLSFYSPLQTYKMEINACHT